MRLCALALLLGCEPDPIKIRESAADSGGDSPADSPAVDSTPDSEPADDSDPPVDTADWPAPGAACGLASDLSTPWFLEGDTVTFLVSCSGALATEDARIEALSLPDGADYDAATRRFSWQTGPADGGRIDAVFSISPTDGSADVPTAETITFWVADDATASDNVAVDPATYHEEWGLPVFHIDTTGTISTGYSDATVTVRGVTLPASIKIRGASSAYYTKPSYTLEFNGEELEVPEWGVSRDHLLLVTPFDDNSYVRQKLVYDLWAAMAEHAGQVRMTPRTFFAVVYMNGSYWGLYTALDRMDDEFLDHMGFERDANLYKAVNHDANFYSTNSSGYAKSTMHDGYTKEEGEDETTFTDLDELVGFTSSAASASDLVDGAPDWIDLQEFMDWFLLVHYTLGEDSGGKNAYLYHPLGGGQFRFGPWDFNHSWGQGWYTYRIDAENDNYYTWNNRVFWAIQNDAEASAELWERFASLRADGGPLSEEWQLAQLDDYYALIEPSAVRDWDRWASSYYSYGSWAGTRNAYGDWQDYQGEKAYLYQWVEDRAAYFWELHP